MKKKLFSLITALLLCLFCTLSAFAEMPLVMDTYTHTTETETYDPVKDNSSSSGSSTDSGGFLCESRRWPFIGIFRYDFEKCSAV